jgi:hypothetical protein
MDLLSAFLIDFVDGAGAVPAQALYQNPSSVGCRFIQ